MVIINNSKCNSYNSNNQTSLWIVLVTQEKETDYNIFDKEKCNKSICHLLMFKLFELNLPN